MPLLLLKYWRVGLAAVLLIAAFGSGWTVRSWRCDSAMAKVQAELQEAVDAQRARADAAAASYEATRAALNQQSYATQTTIREYYRENPVNPDCAAGEPIVNSLRAAVEAANRAASGEPAPAVSEAPTAP